MDKELLSEFSIPLGELDASLQTGDYGDLCLRVEVIAVVDGIITFRKHKKATIQGDFKPEGAKELRERILDKQDKEESEDK